MHRPFLHKSTPRSKTSDALYSFDWRGVRASRYGYPLIRFSRFHVHPVQSGKSKSEVILLQLLSAPQHSGVGTVCCLIPSEWKKPGFCLQVARLEF
jgi:hypothetical protein